MAQSDLTIQNQSFPSFRTDLNNALTALNSMQSGTSRPASAVAGTMWLDITNATNPTIKFFDGNDDITFATVDYSANTINFSDSATDLLGDTTPQLGGMLDVNGQAIGDGTLELIKFLETASAVNEITIANADTTNAPEISATGDDTNIDLKLTPKGSGNLVLDGIKFPNADGTANQVLQTDGSGNLSFSNISGGISWQSVQTTGFTASAGNGYPCDTTSAEFTVTLPATPSAGQQVQLVDYAGTFDTNNLTINPNGEDIEGGAGNLGLTGEREGVILTYIDSTQGWIATSGINEGTDALEPVPYSIDFLVVAGGGSGGRESVASGVGGGGGAGGYRTSTQTVSGGTEITVTVGDGGSAVGGGGGAVGNDGSNSSISGSGLTTITSTGGGGGGGGTSIPDCDGRNGGSGGGAGNTSSTAGSGNTPSTSPSQGNNGGTCPTATTAGGGGGASEAGNTDGGGQGGDGTASSITGSSVIRAGGGGGSNPSGGSAGGDGGGGAGANDTSSVAGTSGTANTGGGGGGAGNNGGNTTSGAGGKGVVILAMPLANFSTTVTGSPVESDDGTTKVLIFNGDGSYTT